MTSASSATASILVTAPECDVLFSILYFVVRLGRMRPEDMAASVRFYQHVSCYMLVGYHIVAIYNI